MNCDYIRTQLDDYLDGSLNSHAHAAVSGHIESCEECRQELATRRELAARLRELPVPSMSPGFRDRAYRQAIARNRKPVAFAAGLGAAVAAGLIIWAVLLFPQAGIEPPAGGALQTVQLQVESPSQVSLVFNSAADIHNVDIHIELPQGVALAGYPGRTQLSWQDHLQQGRNVLNLTLVAESGAKGELVSTISHAGEQRVFRVAVHASDLGAVRMPVIRSDADTVHI